MDFTDVQTRFFSNTDVNSLEDQHKILGIISFTSDEPINSHKTIGHHQVKIPAEDLTAQTEVWYGTGEITRGKWQDIDFAYDQEHLWGAVSYNIEADHLHADRTEEVYCQILQLLKQKAFTNLYRMWSYIPEVNRDNSKNIEIYKEFCFGRSAAFSSEFSQDIAEIVPAATGIGSIDDKVLVYFLAKKNSDQIHIENPMQVPAYHYPPKYGVKAPSFSRATYIPIADSHYQLYLSGTASVVGHSSHHDCVEKQCKTTLLNIERLIAPENLSQYGIDHPIYLSDLDAVKVYIRHRSDFDRVKDICSKAFKKDVSIIYLHADICRIDLLMELEGVFSGPIKHISEELIAC